jgi:periplasmic divalent cation tolerance protein
VTSDQELCEVIVTAPDGAWLEDLCRQLVTKHLASSAHVIHNVHSIYRWQAAIHEIKEARAFLRSRTSLLDALIACVIERHPYDVPNVTALPITGGNPDYLDWIRAFAERVASGDEGEAKRSESAAGEWGFRWPRFHCRLTLVQPPSSSSR